MQGAARRNLGFSVSPMDTSTKGKSEPGFEPLLEDQLYQLGHSIATLKLRVQNMYVEMFLLKNIFYNISVKSPMAT